MRAVHLDEARLYDEQFAEAFPSDWEMAILSKYLGSAKTLPDVGCGTRRARGMRKSVVKSLEYGDYMETTKLDHHADKLTFHAFTAREARRLLADRGLQAKVEKRAKFFHDWFIVVATRRNKHKEAS
jgi:hypothetical protein